MADQPNGMRRGQFPFRALDYHRGRHGRHRHRIGANPRQPRRYYTRVEKAKAVELLNKGMRCRQVARLMGNPCSAGTPSRWRKQDLIALPIRERLAKMFEVIPQTNLLPPGKALPQANVIPQDNAIPPANAIIPQVNANPNPLP